MITVLGATGHTGRPLVEKLLAAGEKVRAVSRNTDKARDLAAKGAEVVGADASDAAALATAFRGADVVYTLIPPSPAEPDFDVYQDRVGTATAEAIRSAGVKKAVLLSSLGADLPSGTGPIAGLHRQEARLRELGIDALLLRPTYFIENFYANLPMMKHQGINGGAIAPDVKFPMIAARDIADVAARRILARDWKGAEVHELLGAREYSMREATTLIGQRIGKPDLQYVQFPYEDFAKALTGFGLSASIAGKYAEMSKAFNDGLVRSEPRSARNTTPTTFEAMLDDFARAYEAA